MAKMQDAQVLFHAEPMSRHTSWRVGGPADVFFRPRSVAELQAFLRALPSGEALTWVGLGSNLLVRDGGLRGTVISTSGLPGEIERVDETRVRADAGVTCAKLARAATQWQLGPAAFFAGIPGTIGGALAMNAGAFGGETWDNVVSVQTVDRAGELRERPRADFGIGYRSVGGPESEWFIGATFRFEPDAAIDMTAVRKMLARRNESQPTGQASCGSVFRNPPGGFAGRLIEQAGLKGWSLGGAHVSDKHANFIINDGTASAADIEALITGIRAKVLEATGVELVLEVRLVGEKAGDGP